MKKISEICDKTFTVKSAMKKHAASVHEKKKKNSNVISVNTVVLVLLI